MSTTQTLLDLSAPQARANFLRGKIYCEIEIPSYFVFDDLLDKVAKAIGDRGWADVYERKEARKRDDVNYQLLSNKDGRYAWRQYELIHPVMYALLVNQLTEDSQWDVIRERFVEFTQANPRIRCLSLPVAPPRTGSDKALQVREWWVEVEQQSIALALDYEYALHTDVVDCYPSIYTHSIAWALHGKAATKTADGRNDNTLIGNLIDWFMQDMRYGQTNGIPQGSVLMDFIAEMVLGYADLRLAAKLQESEVDDFHILRYRDDYRIFVNSPIDGELILKSIAEVMIDLRMKLHPQKTTVSHNVVRSSIKEDKWDWLSRRHYNKSIQKHLLTIHDHSVVHTNAGSVNRALTVFFDRLEKMKKCDYPVPLISIAVDIAYRNPRTYPIVSAIVSRCQEFLDTKGQKKDVVARIRRRFSKVPNAGLMELWLQRICLHQGTDDFGEPLCQLVAEKQDHLWNNDWIKMPAVRAAVDAQSIVDRSLIATMPPVVSRQEVELFPLRYG